MVYFDFNWSNVTPFVWIQLTLKFHSSLFSSSQSNGKSILAGLHIIEFVFVLKKSHLIILTLVQRITTQRCIIIAMRCNISLILGNIGRNTKLICNIDFEYNLSGRNVEKRRIWNERCVIIYAIFITLDCEERFEDIMRLRETSLCHYASHKVIYSRERTQLGEPMLYFFYFLYTCTHSMRTSKC